MGGPPNLNGRESQREGRLDESILDCLQFKEGLARLPGASTVQGIRCLQDLLQLLAGKHDFSSDGFQNTTARTHSQLHFLWLGSLRHILTGLPKAQDSTIIPST